LYSAGVAAGLMDWVSHIVVTTSDTGNLGSGTNVPTPVSIPSSTMFSNLMTGMASFGFFGVISPLFCKGLADGLCKTFAQSSIMTIHPSVGSGVGIATFIAPPCGPYMADKFGAVGMNGPQTIRDAFALGLALDITLQSIMTSVTIVGSPTPVPGTGKGVGKIL
jgi:hypothetical protein